MKTTAIFLASGFEEIEAITVIDVLRRAGIPVQTVSMTGQYEVTGGHQIPVRTDRLFEEFDFRSLDMIILPGGAAGVENLNAHEGLKTQLRQFCRNGKLLAAICAAPKLPGQLGLLEGKRAVCYPGLEKELKGALLSEAPVITDGNIITSRGIGTALDFALEIVRLLEGADKAGKLAASMVYV
ncbi:MAG: DJ-1 family glyoxalase III [Mangrovibacterium sp.]